MIALRMKGIGKVNYHAHFKRYFVVFVVANAKFSAIHYYDKRPYITGVIVTEWQAL